MAVTLGIATLFLAFASLLSLLAPVHVLTLERDTQHDVRADVTQQLLLFIPVRTQTLLDVHAVTTRTHREPAHDTPTRRPTDVGPVVVRPEAEGFLVVSGARGSVEIATSPAKLDETRRRLAEFLDGSDSQLRLHLASNWKVGVLVTALIALPGVLILLAVAWDISMTARRFVSGNRAGSRTG